MYPRLLLPGHRHCQPGGDQACPAFHTTRNTAGFWENGNWSTPGCGASCSGAESRRHPPASASSDTGLSKTDPRLHPPGTALDGQEGESTGPRHPATRPPFGLTDSMTQACDIFREIQCLGRSRRTRLGSLGAHKTRQGCLRSRSRLTFHWDSRAWGPPKPTLGPDTGER